MKLPGFIGGAYTLPSRSLDAQRCINLYPIMDEMGTGKDASVGMLALVPGKREFVEFGTGDIGFETNIGPIRGLYCSSAGVGFSVVLNNLYLIGPSGTKTIIGILSTTSGIVSFADNGVQLMLVDGEYGYIYTFATGVFLQVTDSDMPKSSHVRFLDGYFVLNQLNSGRFFITSLYDGYNIDALDFATAEASPDNILAIEVLRRQLWLFGTETTQVYYNSGDADFPFSPLNGVLIEAGCASSFSVTKVDQTLFWLGSNKDGNGVVYMANGYQPQRISTNAIETSINSYDNISNAVSLGYQQQGATFFQLNFDETSWVYDLNSRMWHERCKFESGEFFRDRANNHMFFAGKHIVGAFDRSTLYELNLDYYKDGPNDIKWLRASPHVASDNNFIYYSVFNLDMQFGVGDYDDDSDGNFTEDPSMIMRVSDDGGFTWSNERYKSMGKIGEYNARAKFNRCGRSRNRVFEVSGTCPVKTYLIGADIEIAVTNR